MPVPRFIVCALLSCEVLKSSLSGSPSRPVPLGTPTLQLPLSSFPFTQRSMRTQSLAHPGSRPGPCQHQTQAVRATPARRLGLKPQATTSLAGTFLRPEKASGLPVASGSAGSRAWSQRAEHQASSWRDADSGLETRPVGAGQGWGTDTECGSGEVPRGSGRDVLRVEPGQGGDGKGGDTRGALRGPEQLGADPFPWLGSSARSI